MAQWHGYLGIESLTLNSSQRAALVQALGAVGRDNTSDEARRRMHFITRNDRRAAIFEAVFDDTDLSIPSIKAFLGAVFGISPATINHALTTAAFGNGTTQVLTLSRLGVDALRVAAFGGVGSTWNESRLEAVAYLVANNDDWEQGFDNP